MKNLKLKILILYAKFTGRKIVHYLHIGKTAGSALRLSIGKKRISKKFIYIFHGHDFTLKNVPENDLFVFFLRDPISRYVSGFYSRKRKGRPLYNNPWHPEEEIAFNYFSNPNSLAEALSSSDIEIADRAMDAMLSIHHVKTTFKDWLISDKYFNSRMDSLFYLGFVESFDSDFNTFCNKLELRNFHLNTSSKSAHKSPKDEDRHLSELAISNLTNWYKWDIDFYTKMKKTTSQKQLD